MAPTAGPSLGRRLRLAVAAVAVLTPLAVATAGVATAAPTGGQAAGRPADAPGGFVFRGGRYPNGAVSTIDVPGASSTTVYGTNNRGQLVGSYVDADGREHGFLLERDKVTAIDHPDAPDDPAASNTAASDVNDRGQIVGFYADASGTYHGYLYDKGRFTRIDPPAPPTMPASPRPRPRASTTAARS
jgi:probable HAF family extracellular repeat protein